MFTYEFVTPSDPITFKASNDRIAFVVSLVLGNGKAGCSRILDQKQINVPSLFLFVSDPEAVIQEYLGEALDKFIEKNKQEIADSFCSFAYTSLDGRDQFDQTLDMIPCEKKQEFLDMHEDTKRSSTSRWVKHAWKTGNGLKLKPIKLDD